MSKIIALIPARGGSKRIPKKNTRLLNGIPLIGYTICSAFATNIFEKIIVSTDDKEIAEIAKKFGAAVPSLRPKEFALDSSPDIEWVTHALEEWCPENTSQLALLRPTSPLRKPQTIVDAIDRFRNNDWADSLRAMQLISEHPGKMWRVKKNGEATPFLNQVGREVPMHSSPTNTLESLWVQNASLEIIRASTVFEKKSIAGDNILSFQMPNFEGFDINTELDWKYVSHLVSMDPLLLPKLGLSSN
jgi:CMP-N,N'-diacetyllegionaminic acid synthase